MKTNLTEGMGWYGVVAILSAYALSSFGYIETTSQLYQLLNLTGALGVAFDAYSDKNLQPMVLNILWAIVALVAMVVPLA